MPRLEFSAVRECPPDALRLCREVRPDVAVIYLGEARWSLGFLEPTGARWRIGQNKLRIAREMDPQQIGDDPTRLAGLRDRAIEGELLCQGFAPIQILEQPDPDSYFAEFLRAREYAWADVIDRELDRLHFEELYELSPEAREAEEDRQVTERIIGDGYRLKDGVRWATKHPVSVTAKASSINTTPIARK